jgi:hypothetical protein
MCLNAGSGIRTRKLVRAAGSKPDAVANFAIPARLF